MYNCTQTTWCNNYITANLYWEHMRCWGVNCVCICTQTLRGWSRKLLMPVPIGWEAEIEDTACELASCSLAGSPHQPVVRQSQHISHRIDFRQAEGWLPPRIQHKFIDCSIYIDARQKSVFSSSNTHNLHVCAFNTRLPVYHVPADYIHVLHTYIIWQC